MTGKGGQERAMKVTAATRRILGIRREERNLKGLGYRKHETDWEIHRGITRAT